jgi:uncharacterized membrane protein YeaQ/YmgE (transglycosylase-associated protein family)
MNERTDIAMSFIWMILAGVIPSAIATLLLKGHNVSGLFILGVGGAIIAGLMQYAENQPIGFIGPFVGAVILLAVYAFTASRPIAEKADRDDFRKAA